MNENDFIIVDDVAWESRSKNCQELLRAIRQDVYRQGYEIDDKNPFRINYTGIMVRAKKIKEHRNPHAWETLEYFWNEPVPYPIRIVKEKKSLNLTRRFSFITWDTVRFYSCIVSAMFFILFGCAAVFFFLLGGLINLLLFLICVIISAFCLVAFCFMRGEGLK